MNVNRLAESAAARSVSLLELPSPVHPVFPAGLDVPADGWGLVVDLDACGCEGGECHLACALQWGLGTTDSAPDRCVQCLEPPCAAVCPVDAISQGPGGVVNVDSELCIGCLFCQDACPVGGFVVLPFRTRKVVKCNMCSHRLAQGLLPACVDACPEGAIWIANFGPTP